MTTLQLPDLDRAAPEPDLAATFAERGYVVLRSVLDTGEVERVRALCTERLTGDDGAELLSSQFLAIPELATIPLRERVVAAAREVLGKDVSLYPNLTARKNVYVPWHVDDTFVGPGREYAWEPDFVHVQAGLYLQANTAGIGGGVDVIRGSHLISFDGYGRVPPEFEVATWTLGRSSLRETVDTRAGDLLLWHGRLMHSSTPVTRAPGREKLGVFFSYGRHHLRDNSRFLCNLVANRVRTMNGHTGVIPRLAEIPRLRYPDSFPDAFVRAAETARVHIAVF